MLDLTDPDVLDIVIDPQTQSTVYALTGAGLFVVQQEALRQKHVPLADAGDNILVECASSLGTGVTLDASRSSDPDGDILSYVWTGPFGRIEGPQPTVMLPPGVSEITLVVSDGQE